MRYKGDKGKAWQAVKTWCRATYTDCYTCPARDLQGYNAHSGHCWPVGHVGSNNTLSWDHRQIRLQCGRCNGAGQGMQVQFRAGLVREYGEKEVEEMEVRRYKVDPVKDWVAVKQKYANTLNNLERD